MLRKILTTASVVLSTCGIAMAADSTTAAKTPPPVSISGSVDGYYRYNFDDPKGGTNNKTSFTNSQNSFELGMATLRADHSFGKVSATADLGFGRRAAEFSYNDSASNQNLAAIKQLYVTYQATSKIKFTLGKWGTHIGYEVLDAYSNRNYSMDYMFSYGPFFHTGIKADVTLSGTTAFMVGVANPTDFSSTSSSTKVAIAQFSTGTKDGKWKGYLNYQGYYGVSTPYVLNSGTAYTLYKNLSQIDLVVNGTLNSKWGIGYNGTYQAINDGSSKDWWGSALYLNYDPKSNLGFTLRGEYFSDKDGIKLAQFDGDPYKGDVTDFTLTALWKVESNLTIMPEIRLDNTSKDGFFAKSNGVTSTNSTVSALVAAVYKF